eukprot:g44390.t1
MEDQEDNDEEIVLKLTATISDTDIAQAQILSLSLYVAASIRLQLNTSSTFGKTISNLCAKLVLDSVMLLDIDHKLSVKNKNKVAGKAQQ